LEPGKASIRERVTGVILAGGRATRMGGIDKGLVSVNGRTMISYAIEALRPQVDALLINANRNHDNYASFGYPVVADADCDFRGPLAGFASGMAAARTAYVAFAPCDSPLLCRDLVQRLHGALAESGVRIAVAHDGNRLQPVFALLDRALLGDLSAYLDAGGRKIDRWYSDCGFATADFSDATESFLNINAPADKLALESRLARRDTAGPNE